MPGSSRPTLRPWRGLALALGLALAGALPLCAQDTASFDDRSILRLIGALEGPAGYNDLYRGSPIAPEQPLVTMTLAEVLAFQDAMVAAGARSSAVGKYQFIRKTLRAVITQEGIDPERRFDRGMQDRLARVMLDSCDFYSLEHDETQIGNCLARVWAALPVMSGKNRGKSYYHGIAGNRSLTTPERVSLALQERHWLPRLALPSEVVLLAEYSAQRTARTSAARTAVVPVSYPDDGRMADRVPLFAR